LVILDVMIPKLDGLQVCQYIRLHNNKTPILMVTALDQEDNIIDGLNSGADDYITKPFSPKEVIARINAILRRSKQEQTKNKDNILTIGDIAIYPDRYEAFLKETTLQLTRKEYELLLYFVKNKDFLLSRDQL